jgi:hypothetical protein
MPDNISPNIFTKCAPAIGTNIRACGSVTVCNTEVITADNIESVFTDGNGNFRVMDSLGGFQMEVKACGAAQIGMFDFLMSNRVNWNKRIRWDGADGLIHIRPFVLARRKWPINNKYWNVSGGQASGENWRVDVTSPTGIPFDVRSFIADEYVYINSEGDGGTLSETMWKIVSSTALSATSGRLVLSPLNAGSFLDPDKLSNPVTGWLIRGTNNKDVTESFCNEPPAYITTSKYPAWFGTSRITTCKSDFYDEYRAMLLKGNTYFAEFQDLPEAEVNRQVGQEFQERMAYDAFYSKGLVNQGLTSYDQLEEITTAASNYLDVPTSGRCRGRRANVVGILEQLAECDRVADLQGGQLVLSTLWRTLYLILRSRQSNGDTSNMIDLFMDTTTASRFHLAMVNYYNSQNSGLLRVNMDMGGDYKVTNPYSIKKANFGFSYRTYPLEWPQGLVINVVTHFFFDDLVTQAQAIGNTSLGRNIWILDFSGIYPFTVATDRTVTRTNPAALQGIDATYACTPKILTEQTTMNSFTWGMHVECPRASIVLENVSDEVPNSTEDDGTSVYPADGSGVTTTPQD